MELRPSTNFGAVHCTLYFRVLAYRQELVRIVSQILPLIVPPAEHINLPPTIKIRKDVQLSDIDFDGTSAMSIALLPQMIARVEIEIPAATGISHSNFVYQEDIGRFVLMPSSDPFVVVTMDQQVFTLFVDAAIVE